MKACECVTEVSLGVVFFGLVVVLPCAYVCLLVYRYIDIYICIYMSMVDQNSFNRKRPIFANKNVTFAKLSPTPRLSFAGPMLGNNASYEDSFTTCQIMPENHGVLDSLFKHAASITESLLRTDLLTSFFFARFADPPPSTCTLTFAHSFAELSRKYPYSQTPAISTPGALVFGTRKASLLETCLLHLELAS